MSQADTLTPDLETPPAGFDEFYEVVNGQFVEQPPMSAFETYLATALVEALSQYFTGTERLGRIAGETLFVIDPKSALQRRPDLAFISYARWPKSRPVPRKAAWDVVPDLAVEVVSPSNSADDVNDKVGEYLRAGVRSVWVLYPKTQWVYVFESLKRITIYEAGEELSGGDVLPDFRVRVAALFDDTQTTP